MSGRSGPWAIRARVHWQLDVFWSDLETRPKLDEWLRRYEERIARLILDFRNALKKGVVLGMVPFIPVMKSLLTGESTPHVRCGAGATSFAIMTNGHVDACPIAPELGFNHVSDINSGNPMALKGSMSLGLPCTSCGCLRLCGGRCLFVNKTKFWGDEMYDRVCRTTKSMIRELEEIAPIVMALIEEGVLSIADFDYPEVNNGCEIIP